MLNEDLVNAIAAQTDPEQNDNAELAFHYQEERTNGPLVDINIPRVNASRGTIRIKNNNTEAETSLNQDIRRLNSAINVLIERLNRGSESTCCFYTFIFLLLIVSITLSILILIHK